MCFFIISLSEMAEYQDGFDGSTYRVYYHLLLSDLKSWAEARVSIGDEQMSLLFCDVVTMLEKIKMINKCVHNLLMSIKMTWTNAREGTNDQQMYSLFIDVD